MEISVSDTELMLRRKYLSEDVRLPAACHCNRLYPETMIMFAYGVVSAVRIVARPSFASAFNSR